VKGRELFETQCTVCSVLSVSVMSQIARTWRLRLTAKWRHGFETFVAGVGAEETLCYVLFSFECRYVLHECLALCSIASRLVTTVVSVDDACRSSWCYAISIGICHRTAR